jgi:spermidine synthase
LPEILPDTELSAINKPRGVTVLFLAFFLSGMSGLIYQTVWVRMLTRYLGSTTASTATVLCVFMGGLALGALLGGRLADQIKRKLLGYVILEICIAAVSVLMSFLIIFVLGGFYINLYPWFSVNVLWLTTARIVFCVICLLFPTVLMGATLPLLVSFITQNNYGFQKGLGHLYSINTFGAVLGVFITGFVLIGALGERSSLYFAALLNLLAASFVYRFEKKSLYPNSKIRKYEFASCSTLVMPSLYSSPIIFWSRIAIFVSGFSALAYEVLWTRFLMLPLLTSIYAFSLMLGIFLLGIAFGSWLSTRFKISETRPAAMFAFFEILIGFLTATGMTVFLVFGQVSKGFTGDYLFGILTSFLIVFPVAVIFGWQFPIAVRCCISDASRPGKETGWAYSANTAGAILGSVIAGFVLIPVIGTAKSFMMIAVLNTVIGIILLCLIPQNERGKIPVFAGMLTVIFILMIIGAGDPYRKVIYERVYKIMGKNALIYAFYEDVAGNTVPAGSPENQFNRELFVNGIGMTRLVIDTKLMAHLPLTLISDPKKILVVCFGMGTTVRSASRYPISKGTMEINAVDIVPKVFDCFKYFHGDADRIISLPNVHLYVDDGRNFMLVHPELYDVITVDPAPPLHSAGTVNLYTREFFELCKSKINKNGIVCVWLPPAPVTESMMIMKTFVNAFPGASLWGGLGRSGFYLIGGHHSFDQTDETLTVLAGKISKIKDISEWSSLYGNEENLKQLYLLDSKDFAKIVENVWEVTDDRPYIEFPIWRGILTGEFPVLTAEDVRKYEKNISGRNHL